MLPLTKLVRYIERNHYNKIHFYSHIYLSLNHEYIGIKFNPALHHMEDDMYIYYMGYNEHKNYINGKSCYIKIDSGKYYCCYWDKAIIIERR